MKSAILILALALPVAAQNNGPSANGTFQFNVGNSTKTIEFNARTHNNGSASGQMVFSGGDDIPELANMSMTVEFDCLKIDGNRAIMSGEVTDSSNELYIGLRALFVVEDGGEGTNQPVDRFTWGVYHAPETGWVPTDAELDIDTGAGLSWLASDFEREDDIPVPSHPANSGISCESFALSAYALEDVARGGGNIQVKP